MRRFHGGIAERPDAVGALVIREQNQDVGATILRLGAAEEEEDKEQEQKAGQDGAGRARHGSGDLRVVPAVGAPYREENPAKPPASPAAL